MDIVYQDTQLYGRESEMAVAKAIDDNWSENSANQISSGDALALEPNSRCERPSTPGLSVPERPDVLWCLCLREGDKPDRTFYKDTAWKGINNSLPGSDPDADMDSRAIMTYTVDADVWDITGKEPNTSNTWREKPVEIEFGKDAVLFKRFPPFINIHSQKLLKVLNAALGYYPYRMNEDTFHATIFDCFPELMYSFQDLKQYLESYTKTLPEEKRGGSRWQIGNSGDDGVLDPTKFGLRSKELEELTIPCDEVTAQDLAVLLRLLAGMYRVKVVSPLTAINLEKSPMVAFNNIWLLFRPGTIVYVKQSAFEEIMDPQDEYAYPAPPGRIRVPPRSLRKNRGEVDDEYSACVVARWSYKERDLNDINIGKFFDRLDLRLWNIQWSDTTFQRIAYSAVIAKFDNTIPLKDLPIVPAEIYDRIDNGQLRRRLQDRGRKYVTILKEPAAHREYSHKKSGYEGQVIVDPAAYRQSVADEDRPSPSSPPVPPPPAPIADGGGNRYWFADLTDLAPDKVCSFPQADDFYLLLPRRTEGFALRTKKWMVFEIEGISEEAPKRLHNQLDSELVLVSDTDRESLRTVLPRGEPSLSSASDFVAGKGEGKIFLLYGGPGTGKTLTVECVANDTRRPLLRITAQDVGLADGVESQLRNWFTLAAKWDAILLIDEADLFLEQRKEGDLRRNSLSTVFLRTMEYYKGVLFLTTNRPGHIDDSFISRITCPIGYPPLSPETKAKIVTRFVKRFEETGKIVVEEAASRYLISHCSDLNGRELRNVLQNAVAAAETKVREDLERLAKANSSTETVPILIEVKIRHVKAAVERQVGFKEYLKNVRGRSEDTRAQIKHDYLSRPQDS